MGRVDVSPKILPERAGLWLSFPDGMAWHGGGGAGACSVDTNRDHFEPIPNATF